MPENVVKVTPSASEGRSGRAGGGLGSAFMGVKKSSNGVEMMPDETEQFTCRFTTATSRVKQSGGQRFMEALKRYMMCQACCECTEPKRSYHVDVLVTEKRLVLRYGTVLEEPGAKKCGYYWGCMFCCEHELRFETANQLAIDLRDVREYGFDLQSTHSQRRNCMCCITARDTEAFAAQLLLTKTLGESRRDWSVGGAKWILDKETKTYTCTLSFDGFMEKEVSMQLRQVLHAVCCNNAPKAAGCGVLGAEVGDATRLSVHLGA